jgi:hypothetical protein
MSSKADGLAKRIYEEVTGLKWDETVRRTDNGVGGMASPLHYKAHYAKGLSASPCFSKTFRLQLGSKGTLMHSMLCGARC